MNLALISLLECTGFDARASTARPDITNYPGGGEPLQTNQASARSSFEHDRVLSFSISIVLLKSRTERCPGLKGASGQAVSLAKSHSDLHLDAL